MLPKTETPPDTATEQNNSDNHSSSDNHSYQDDTEPRWPAIIGLLGSAGLFAVLPKYLSFGPRWLPAVIISVLLVPTLISRLRGHHTINRVLGLTVAGVETFFLIASLLKLVHTLIEPHTGAQVLSPVRLLISAGALWLTNVLIFALWYWHLDAGGPHERDRIPGHDAGSFLFPQMTMSDERLAAAGFTGWSPGFMDYLFLAFNTSTALSPADTAALSRWAKFLMMIQALISLTVIAVLAARAINTLS